MAWHPPQESGIGASLVVPHFASKWSCVCSAAKCIKGSPYKYIGFGDSYGPKPYKFIGFGDSYGPKPYKFIGFGDSYGPKPYKFIRFGDSYGPKPYKRAMEKTMRNTLKSDTETSYGERIG